ncbi:MAG: hypothetical protein R2777_00055 [Chitinophagales bacterium]
MQFVEYFNTAKTALTKIFLFIQYGDCGFNSTAQHEIGALMEADGAEFAVVCGDVDQGGVPHVAAGSGGINYDDIFFDVYNNGTTKCYQRECHYTAIETTILMPITEQLMWQSFILHIIMQKTQKDIIHLRRAVQFIALDVITPYDPTTVPIDSL